MDINQGYETSTIRKPILIALILLAAWATGGLLYIYFNKPRVVQNNTSEQDNFFYDPIWTHNAVGQVLSTPIFVGNRIIYGTLNGKLAAISRKDGRLEWVENFNAPIFSLTQDNDGIIFVGTGLHYDTQAIVAAIDSKDGKILWNIKLFGHLEEPPLIDTNQHRLWAGLGPGGLWAIDTRDGSKIYNVALGHVDTTPLLFQGKIFAPFQNSEDMAESTFYAFDAGTGKIVWKTPLQGQPWAAPILNDTNDMILTNTGIGQIGVKRTTDRGWAQAIDLSGKLIWETELPGMALPPNILISKDNMIIYTCKNGYLVALNIETGKKIWKNKIADEINAEATATQPHDFTTLAVLSQEGKLIFVDTKSGQVLSHIDLDEKSAGAPATDGDIILLPTSFKIQAITRK